MLKQSKIIITSPSLDTRKNIGGISSVTKFIIENNKDCNYRQFELGKYDNERRGILWFIRIISEWASWLLLMIGDRNSLIHFNFALDKRSIIRDSPLILFARTLKKRIVIHLHGGEYLEKEITPNYIKTILTLILSGEQPKIVLSPIERETIEIKYRAQNIIVLPNCVDIKDANKFNRTFPCEYPLKILFIGRIVNRKGIENILQAFAILKGKGIQFKYIMAGDGPDKQNHIEKCLAILGSSFEFVGVVSGKAKLNLLKECSVFLLPSLYGEGLPVSLLECMSFQMVPIVTDDGSMKYIIEDGINGIIVKKGSSVEIAKAVENLVINSNLLKEISRNALQYVLKNHNPIDYINKLNRIYNQA